MTDFNEMSGAGKVVWIRDDCESNGLDSVTKLSKSMTV
jgi:hypothetical protein